MYAFEKIKPLSVFDYKFASNLSLDISRICYILSVPGVSDDNNLLLSFKWLDISLNLYNKSNYSNEMYAYRLQFKLRLIRETNNFENVITIINESLSYNAFNYLTASNGLLCLLNMKLNDSIIKTLVNILENKDNNINYFLKCTALNSYYYKNNNIILSLKYFKDAMKVKESINNNSIFDLRIVKGSEYDLKNNEDEETLLYNYIYKVVRQDMNYVEGYKLCIDYFDKYINGKYKWYAFQDYTSCLYNGFIRNEFKKRYVFPFWSFSKSEYKIYKELVNNEIKKYFIVYNNIGLSELQKRFYFNLISSIYSSSYNFSTYIDYVENYLSVPDNYNNNTYTLWIYKSYISNSHIYKALEKYYADNDLINYVNDMMIGIEKKLYLLNNQQGMDSKIEIGFFAMSLADNYSSIKRYSDAVDILKKYCLDSNSFNIFTGYARSSIGKNYFEKYRETKNLEYLKLAINEYKASFDTDYQAEEFKIIFQSIACIGYVVCSLESENYDRAFEQINKYLNYNFDTGLVNELGREFHNVWLKYYRLHAEILKARILRKQKKLDDALKQLSDLETKYLDDAGTRQSLMPPVLFKFFTSNQLFRLRTSETTLDDYRAQPGPYDTYAQVKFVNNRLAEIYYERGMCYFESGNNNEAIKWFEKAISLKYNHKTIEVSNPGNNSNLESFIPNASNESIEQSYNMLNNPITFKIYTVNIDNNPDEKFEYSVDDKNFIKQFSNCKIIIKGYNIKGKEVNDNLYIIEDPIFKNKEIARNQNIYLKNNEILIPTINQGNLNGIISIKSKNNIQLLKSNIMFRIIGILVNNPAPPDDENNLTDVASENEENKWSGNIFQFTRKKEKWTPVIKPDFKYECKIPFMINILSMGYNYDNILINNIYITMPEISNGTFFLKPIFKIGKSRSEYNCNLVKKDKTWNTEIIYNKLPICRIEHHFLGPDGDESIFLKRRYITLSINDSPLFSVKIPFELFVGSSLIINKKIFPDAEYYFNKYVKNYIHVNPDDGYNEIRNEIYRRMIYSEELHEFDTIEKFKENVTVRIEILKMMNYSRDNETTFGYVAINPGIGDLQVINGKWTNSVFWEPYVLSGYDSLKTRSFTSLPNIDMNDAVNKCNEFHGECLGLVQLCILKGISNIANYSITKALENNTYFVGIWRDNNMRTFLMEANKSYTYIPGDRVYMKNSDYNEHVIDGDWQGENVIYMGMNKKKLEIYSGMRCYDMTEYTLIDELASHYLSDVGKKPDKNDIKFIGHDYIYVNKKGEFK